MRSRLRVLVTLALLLLAVASPCRADVPAVAVQGRIVLPVEPAEPTPLRGEWGFAWNQYLAPDWQDLPTRAFTSVPSPWNDVTADGKPPGPDGFGSYALAVDCPKGTTLAVEALGQRTASRLFVNGTLVAQHGELGTSAETTRAAIHSRVPVTREFACPLRITLHVANFEHRAGGFLRPLLAGRADALARDREGRVARHAVLLAAYVITGLVTLIIFAARQRERTPLVYGLFCLTMAVYADMIGERLLLRGLPPQIPWDVYMRVEYLSWIGAMALFLMTLRGLFPAEIGRRALYAVLGALGLSALAVLVLPAAVYSHSALPGQAIAVVVSLYFALAIRRAKDRSPFDVRVLLVGLAAVVALLALDLILIDGPRPDRKFAPIGFAVFLLSPAVVLARRLSRALNAEERSVALEENARLREDVERISRHDLKTPLNSILGATRLLAEGRLDADQRELAGVVQRASLRMLEMVNLSLGLYRMEQGSYELHAAPVDLQDVVARVLTDLHGYAQDCGVALHLRGSERAPVRAQGEELLCYSIVANLVKNAIEAAAASRGTVTLELKRGDRVSLSVRNPGRVPPEIEAKFFEKYVTHGKSAGTGLGTYSARLMARVQKGDLAMRTAPEGTTLVLTLPPAEMIDTPVRLTRPADLASDWLHIEGERSVLVVDDDEFSRFVTRRFLPSPPFEVETAANGLQAAEAMERRWPRFLVLDMEMPVRDGLETARWVREQETSAGRPRCHVVMLSGNDDDVSAQQALAAGADRFLSKPITRESLLAALRELDTPAPSPTAAPGPAAEPEAVPDEIVRIHPEWVSYFPKFIRNQRENLESMARALDEGDRRQLEFMAHRAFGGLAAMGLVWAAGETRFIEHQAMDAPSDDLNERIAALREYLERVKCEAA